MPQQMIPAAEYVRMSTEDQEYSIPVQQAAIRQYAAEHGFAICQTYVDPGRTGVLIKHRKALSDLLGDVVAGKANYKAVLVYDVNRWGRFQNPDEAAHYEFICANAGIPVHYCAEQFANDGSMQSSLAKAVKRMMAGEFSRELGAKVYEATKRLVLQGFHAGAVAPYGLERMLVSPSGHRKGILKRGERKNLKTDRVILVRGRKKEVDSVRRIFFLCANEHKNCPQIATQLNSEHTTCRGNPWDCDGVLRILRSPQYLGLNVWARRAQQLYGPSSLRPRDQWITSKAPFKPIIDQATFDKARQTLAAHRVSYTSATLIRCLKNLLRRKGRLTSDIMSKAGLAPSTYAHHFGSLLKAYELVGFTSSRCAMSEHHHAQRTLHKGVLNKLHELFPEHVCEVRSPGEQKGHLEVDGQVRVSVLVCGKPARLTRNGKNPWLVRVSPKEGLNVALICLLDSDWKDILRYYLLRPFGNSNPRSHCFYEEDAWLNSGQRLRDDLGDFCHVVRGMMPPN